ncbi:hypothetical protein TRFO_40683 [Tritrichomonas foetus]|uniref:Uncharacterized protein n=1 Tax=Tritrichomonas foetus TaxID=1144522 RepID=A0A1J4J0S4_9EUKA|nr:hypothetical protein TRFO_40683 [Tritrichomonas foetus]|eukprot:OHS93010.1 hypothetical protein TRFO_40683 [Tritrichomonas foetus]
MIAQICSKYFLRFKKNIIIFTLIILWKCKHELFYTKCYMIFLFFLIDYVNHNTSIFGTLANLLYKIRDRYQNIVLVEAGDEEPHSKHLLKYCIITSPIPSFSVLLDDPDSLITFGISKLYEGKFSFYNNLVKRNISVVISDNYSVKYRIDPVSNRDSSISLNNTEYSFIYNLITKYSVFSSNNPSICKNKKKFPEFFIHVILLFTFITILSFFSNTIFKIPITNTNFWLWKKGMQALEFQKDCNEIDKKIINETLQKSIQTNKDCSTLMKISRKENTIDFHIVSCFILSNGNRFLFTYIDTPTTSPSEMKNHLDVKFSSNTTSTIGDPIFEFFSYRDIIPAQIHFKFSYNSSGTVMIPEDILVTLSKRGESIANFLVIK